MMSKSFIISSLSITIVGIFILMNASALGMEGLAIAMYYIPMSLLIAFFIVVPIANKLRDKKILDHNQYIFFTILLLFTNILFLLIKLNHGFS